MVILRIMAVLLLATSVALSGPASAKPVPGAPGCPMLPADNVLNTDISTMPVHPMSETWKNSTNAYSRNLHPDFGPSFGAQSIPYGMPYEVVDSSRPKIPIDFYYASESDPGPYPLAATTPIEGGHESGGDRHALMVDKDTCTLYEIYDTHYVSPTNSWGGSGAVWNMNSNALRPAGWTSADAAGLPILPLLLRKDEVESGEVKHAIRMTVHATHDSYLWPARHKAGGSNTSLPPMGARFRIRADYDISGFGAEAQVVLTAMKKYGMIVADNGSDWYFGGTSEDGWSSSLISQMKQVPASVFEAVDVSSLMISPDSGQAKQPNLCKQRPVAPVSSGYLAEGATAGDFETWVLVANPGTDTAEACISFMTAGGKVPGPRVTLPPKSRKSVRADDFVHSFDVSTVVDALTTTVLAERAVYSSAPGKSGAHVGKAAPSPENTWFLPEGATDGGFETWVLVANPNNTSSNVSLTYMTEGGPVTGPVATLGPMSRRSFRVNDTVTTYHVSTRVDATGSGVVAERATYASGALKGATESPGTPEPRDSWMLTEGATDGGFETWVLVANPNSEHATVTLTYLTAGGPVTGPGTVIGPNQRRSFRINDTVTTFDVSTRVSADRPVVAERAMYSNHPHLGVGAASGEGVAEPSMRQLLVEGASTGGFETWVLVANPNADHATVTLTYLLGGGQVTGPVAVLGPRERRSFRVNDTVATFDVSTLVSANRPIFAERSVYTPPGPSRDSTAGPGMAV